MTSKKGVQLTVRLLLFELVLGQLNKTLPSPQSDARQ
jgi:hypothetical protein